jgi:hypothetical protein
MKYGDVPSPVGIGPKMRVTVPASVIALAASVPESGNVTSGIIDSTGFQNLTVGLISSQAGELTVQRYADTAGLIPVGAAITASLSAATAAAVYANDDIPWQSFTINVTNTSGSTAANITDLTVVLQA